MKVPFLIAAVVVFGPGSSAHARSADLEIVAESQAVTYGDLDLNSDAGTKALYRRVHAAAKQVCGGASDRELVVPHYVYSGCVKRTVRKAMADVRSSSQSA